jgi:hypothetical protein
MAASNEHIGSSMTYEWNKCAIIKLKEGFTNEYSNMKLDKDTMQKELIRMKTQLLFFFPFIFFLLFTFSRWRI